MSQETKQPVDAQVPAPEHSAQQTPATTAAASSAPSSAQPGAAHTPELKNGLFITHQARTLHE